MKFIFLVLAIANFSVCSVVNANEEMSCQVKGKAVVVHGTTNEQKSADCKKKHGTWEASGKTKSPDTEQKTEEKTKTTEEEGKSGGW